MQIHPDAPSPVQNPLWSTNAVGPQVALERFNKANALCLNVMSEAASSWSGLLGQMLASGTPWEAAGLYVKWLGDRTEQAMKVRQQLGEVWLPESGSAASDAPANKSSRQHGRVHGHPTNGGPK